MAEVFIVAGCVALYLAVGVVIAMLLVWKIPPLGGDTKFMIAVIVLWPFFLWPLLKE